MAPDCGVGITLVVSKFWHRQIREPLLLLEIVLRMADVVSLMETPGKGSFLNQ
jgi:hypothetical protein